MKHLIQSLRQAGKATRLFKSNDGTRVLILPHGGRVLGLFPKGSEENFYWTNPALGSSKSAREFYASDQWHNSGGDRTWLSPEADLFFPNFPDLNRYWQPRSLDPGKYNTVETEDGFRLVNRLSVNLSRYKIDLDLKITKSFGAAPNPLRHERDLDLSDVEYAGYTQFTSLEMLGKSKLAKAHIGLWNLVQMPHGGDLLIPTFSRAQARHIFSTINTIPAEDIITEDHLIRYRMRQVGEHKISIRAVPVCGRIGYIYHTGPDLALIVRNFVVNPSGEYVDVPWTETNYFGFAVQACNVNSGLGQFSELEYHIPAIGHRTGHFRCDDEAQVWAFRGPVEKVDAIAQTLLGGKSL